MNELAVVEKPAGAEYDRVVCTPNVSPPVLLHCRQFVGTDPVAVWSNDSVTQTAADGVSRSSNRSHCIWVRALSCRRLVMRVPLGRRVLAGRETAVGILPGWARRGVRMGVGVLT